jgi:hypothetical protein
LQVQASPCCINNVWLTAQKWFAASAGNLQQKFFPWLLICPARTILRHGR